MARGRFISKSLSSSEGFAALYERAGRLAEFCQALYPLMIAHADDHGRLQGDPFTVKHTVLPVSSRKLPEFQAALEAMHDCELLTWYEVDGRKFIQINKFDQHQIGLHKRTQPRLPEPPRNIRKFREVPGNSGLREEKGREEEEKRREGNADGRSVPDLWSRVVKELSNSLDGKIIKLWFEACVLDRETDGTLTVAVPTALHLEWLTAHYTLAIEQARLRACPSKVINFVVLAAKAKVG